MINVTRSSMPQYEEYCEEIKELWDSHWLTNMGAKHIKEANIFADVYIDTNSIEIAEYVERMVFYVIEKILVKKQKSI